MIALTEIARFLLCLALAGELFVLGAVLAAL